MTRHALIPADQLSVVEDPVALATPFAGASIIRQNAVVPQALREMRGMNADNVPVVGQIQVFK